MFHYFDVYKPLKHFVSVSIFNLVCGTSVGSGAGKCVDVTRTQFQGSALTVF